MTDDALAVIVLGVIALALAVDVAAAVGLARRWAMKIGNR
jgi:hypothetical protein